MAEVINTDVRDMRQIFELFDLSVQYQERKGYPIWRNYDKNTIAKDIKEKNQYKVVIGLSMVMIFSVRYSDKIIWRELDRGNSIYLHRIVVNPAFKGQRLFGAILDWAIEHSKQNRLETVRMDTWAENMTIINYYKSFGFTFVENYTTPDDEELPIHNRNLALTLLEYRIQY